MRITLLAFLFACNGPRPIVTEDPPIGDSGDEPLDTDLIDEQLLWSFDAGTPIEAPVVVDDGRVFVGTTNGDLFALTLETGDVVWESSVGGAIRKPFTAFGGSLFVGAAATIYGLDAEDGGLIWSRVDGNLGADTAAFAGTGFYAGNLIFRWDTTMAACTKPHQDPPGCTRIYRYEDGDLGLPGFGEANELAVGDGDGVGFQGDSEWYKPLTTSVPSSPVVASGQVIVATGAGDVRALRTFNGSTAWTFQPGPAFPNGLAASSGTVYVTGDNSVVYALDAATSAVRWTNEDAAGTLSTPTHAGDSLVFGSTEGFVHRLSATSGNEVWRWEKRGERFRVRPTVAGDVVLVPGADGVLYALALSVEP